MEDTPAGQPTEDRDPISGDRPEMASSAELSRIAERLSDLESQGAEYHRRAAHREAIIDRLHRENEKLRDEARGSVFDPITADLIRLYDSFRRDAGRLAESGAEPSVVRLMESYAEDVELILDRCGLEPFCAAVGEPFRVGEHTVAGTVQTLDEDRRNTIAEVMAAGFRDRVSGQVKRPLRAKFYRLRTEAMVRKRSWGIRVRRSGKGRDHGDIRYRSRHDLLLHCLRRRVGARHRDQEHAR